jgi:hypothetical protein
MKYRGITYSTSDTISFTVIGLYYTHKFQDLVHSAQCTVSLASEWIFKIYHNFVFVYYQTSGEISLNNWQWNSNNIFENNL